MAKISEKEIKLRKARKAVAEATPLSCTQSLLDNLRTNFALSVNLGLSVAELLNFIKDNKAPKDNTFSNFVAALCDDRQHLVHKLFPDATPKPFSVASLVIGVLQLVDNAHLVEGVSAKLVPVLVNDKITIGIKTDPANVKVTEQGLEFIEEAKGASSVFSNPQNYGLTFARLAVSTVEKIISELETAK